MTGARRGVARVGRPSVLPSRRALFVSPHYDDVALSCGGTVALLADRGCTPIVVTVFGGEVTDELVDDFARRKHNRWGLADVDAVREQRQAEDTLAAAVLRARTRWLGIPDAIYRGAQYTSDRQLYDALQPGEMGLTNLVADELQTLPERKEVSTVFVPLAAGRHVDHQLVFLCGQLLAARGVRVLAYEDCPYAIHTPRALDDRLAEIGDCLGPPEYVSVATTFNRRLEAISAYASQVPVVFRFTDDVRTSVWSFCHRLAPELGPIERFWPVLAKQGKG